MASHFIIQHVPTSAVPFYCSACHFKFRRLFAFKSHQKQRRHILTAKSKAMDPKKTLVTSQTPYEITDDDILPFAPKLTEDFIDSAFNNLLNKATSYLSPDTQQRLREDFKTCTLLPSKTDDVTDVPCTKDDDEPDTTCTTPNPRKRKATPDLHQNPIKTVPNPEDWTELGLTTELLNNPDL